MERMSKRRMRFPAAAALFAVAVTFAMGIPGAVPAHEDEWRDAVERSAQRPFSFVLPVEESPYRLIMKPPQTVTMRSGLVRLEPGKGVGIHSTGKNEEMLVILEGRGEVELEGCGRLNIAGGQAAYVPPRTRHNVFNTGTGPLKYIFIVARALE